MIYLFDVDGTLTPSRGTIDLTFKPWFINFCRNNRVCLVTGSDYAKTLEQLGEDVLDVVETSFNCSGNAVYKNHQTVYVSDWKCPYGLWLFLENELYASPYAYKLGRHFEERIGMLNFSIVGRSAVGHERTDYYNWDQEQKERVRLARHINSRFPEVHAVVGGETGIDIFENGKDKSQALSYFEGEEVAFFGDRMDPDGNDYPLSKAILDNNLGKCYNVKNWRDTWIHLQQIQNQS